MPKERKRKRDVVGRPETAAESALEHYDSTEAERYTNQNPQIQSEMTEVALKLLSLTHTPSLILDLGCGSCLSADAIRTKGHWVIGVDTSAEMLALAPPRCKGMVLRGDLGQGLPFRSGPFDSAISISAIQWLLQSKDLEQGERFFKALKSNLRPEGHFACQVYPSSKDDAERLACMARTVFPLAGYVAAAPHGNRAIKHFLVSSTHGDCCPVVWPYQASCDSSEPMAELHRRHLRRVEGALATLVKQHEQPNKQEGKCKDQSPYCDQEVVACLLANESASTWHSAVASWINEHPQEAIDAVRRELARCKDLKCFENVVFRCKTCDVEVKNAELLQGHLKGKKHLERIKQLAQA